MSNAMGAVEYIGDMVVEFVIPSSSKVPFIIDSSAMSLILKYEVFFGGQRLSSAPEADDRSTGWGSVGRWGRIASGTLSVANADVQMYINKMVYQTKQFIKDYKIKPLQFPVQTFVTTVKILRQAVVHTTVPSNATTYALNTAEVAPINSSGMNGGTSTFINGDGYLNNVGQQVNGITGWQLRIGGLNYGIVTDSRAESRFELMKCFHKLNSADMSSSVTQKQFMEESYVIGMSLESYGAESVFYDGVELSNSGSCQLEVTGTFPNCVANVFLVYDKVLTISDGLISYKE
ncbi:hypothetical protein T492DRAFT_847293 [Pavlovales sp. CCMP2436]|nr:hypothetical protein T492DRAFT_847293 [Pavlovales sp. CCMP2436]